MCGDSSLAFVFIRPEPVLAFVVAAITYHNLLLIT